MLHTLLFKNKKSLTKQTTGLLAALLLITSSATYSASETSRSDGRSSTSHARLDDHKPIPHSTVAVASGMGIVRAMLSCATNRYAHGVLGDTIEAGCLIVEDDLKNVYQLELPEHQVFEDLIPRLADIDGDKRNDVVLVRSDSRQGAALSIYSLKESGEAANLE